jgi:hypothetical protein
MRADSLIRRRHLVGLDQLARVLQEVPRALLALAQDVEVARRRLRRPVMGNDGLNALCDRLPEVEAARRQLALGLQLDGVRRRPATAAEKRLADDDPERPFIDRIDRARPGG